MIEANIKSVAPAEVEIEGEVPAEQFGGYWSAAIKSLGKEAEFPGFRKGHVPENVLVTRIGEEKILFEMAELALRQVYPEIVEAHKIDAIGQPLITITKIAKGNPLGFKIRTAVMPTVKLPDYKQLSKKVLEEPDEEIKVEDKEIDQVIEEVRQSRKEKPDSEPPALDDAFAQSVGHFQTLAELRDKIKDNLTKEKELRARDKRRVKIMEAIIEKAELVLPNVLVEAELDKMAGELKSQIEQMGLSFDKYLEHLKKSEAELRESWKADAKKRVKYGLVLNEIAKAEKLVPDEEKVKQETEHLREHYPHADPLRIRTYVESLLANEAVHEFLEQQK